MGTILTVASQKGGVGKTTTVVNLSASLGLAGRRVLLVDLDPQGNASSGVGFSRPSSEDASRATTKGLLGLARSGKPLRSIVKATRFENLSAVVATPELSDLELIRSVQAEGGTDFRKRVGALAGDFDLTIIDCPPSLGGLPTLALSLSDRVLVPIQCEYYAMEGLSQILPIIYSLQKTTNPDLQIAGLLLTMYEHDLELARDVAAEVTDYFKGLVLRTVIPRDVVLAEASSHGVPAFHYVPASRGAWSYLELAKEVLEHDWS